MPVNAQYPNSFPARIAFIGEAPGSDEVAHGIPLVGSSGRVFNAMLRTANLDRSEFFVGNVFDEKIPDNNVANWCAPTAEAKASGFDDLPPLGHLGYLRPEYRHHLDRLVAEMDDVRPNIIVPMGGTALWAFTGHTDISSQRGNLQRAARLVPGAKILPTFHPAFIMRQWKFFVVGVGDFIKANSEGANRELILPHKEILIEPSIPEYRDYADRYLLRSDLLSVDIETGWGQITCIGFAPNAEQAIVVPFVDIRKPNKSYWGTEQEEVDAWEITKEIVESNVPKLGQNFGGYDAFWLLDGYGIRPYNFRHDTRLMHHALYPELPKDLEFMGASYTNQGAWKSWGRKSREKRDS